MTADTDTLDPDLAWDTLVNECDAFKAQLQALSHQLEKHRVKRFLLGKAAHTILQQEIGRVSEVITAIVQASHTVRSTHQPEALRQLEAGIKQLDAEKTAIQTHLPHPPNVRLVDDAISLVTPVCATVWGILLKLGVLTAASFLVVGGPLIIGTGILLKTTYQRLHIRFLQTKIEDRIALVEQIKHIIHTFEKIEDKMHASDTREIRQAVEKHASDTLDQINKLTDLVTGKLAQLEGENIALKKTLKEILKTIKEK